MIGTSWDKTHANINNKKFVHGVLVGGILAELSVCVKNGYVREGFGGKGFAGSELAAGTDDARWRRRYNK